jgi:hypothetical protein
MTEPLPTNVNVTNASINALTNAVTNNVNVVTPLLEVDIIAKSWENEITLETFGNWINVSAYKIECLDLAIKTYRSRLQVFILLSLILSTLSGTVSVAQFGNYSSSLKLFLNSALTISSFVVALLTGAVKTLKLQETLEEYINLKLRWVSLSAKITNEIYLPKRLRRNAEDLISENKGLFLDLLKIDIDLPSHMTVLAAKHIDKGDDIESQYYKYKDNIIKKEKEMNYGCMKFYSLFYDCCRCCYSKVLTKKIVDNRALAKTIKFSQIENATSYKRKAYQYSLSSIMLNNVKHECSELHESKGIKPLDSVPLDSVPLDSVPLDSVPLDSVPLEKDSVPLEKDSVPLDSVPLDSVPLDSVPLDSVPLDSVPLEKDSDEIPIVIALNSIRKSFKKLVPGPSTSSCTCTSPSKEKKNVIKDLEEEKDAK